MEDSSELEVALRRTPLICYGSQLRQELSARNAEFARSRGLPHACSYGGNPVVVYESCNNTNGNFLGASYRAIRANPSWSLRLQKVHTSAGQSLPKAERRWRELDSCMSSDALLMNVFCYPRTLKSSTLRISLGVEPDQSPLFGFRARVPLLNGRADRTEVDMKLGNLLVEAKLTEWDFQCRAIAAVQIYRDLHDAFDCRMLPKMKDKYASYQLIRNVLAAHALGLSFCVILDARRPDLIEAWYAVMRCVKEAELRTKCQVLTWQELSQNLPGQVQRFLGEKYGIEPS